MRHVAIAVALLTATSLGAQPFTIGRLMPYGVTTNNNSATLPHSFIDLSNYARSGGTVSKATVRWSRACTGSAFKVVFVHQTGLLGAYNVVAQRGPFPAFAGETTVALVPPVSLSAGDLLAVVQLQPFSTCGSVENAVSPEGIGTILMTTTDISGGTVNASGTVSVPGETLGARAYSAEPVLVRVLPAAGAVQGVTAFFRTAVQLANPTNGSI